MLVSIAVFAAGALLTPVATPANLMVMEAAGYRFGDYWRLGLVLLVLYGAVGILLVGHGTYQWAKKKRTAARAD